MWAWVSGASRGIGRAVALQLAEQGHDLVLMCRARAAAAAAVASEVRARGRRAEVACFALGDAAATAADAAAPDAAADAVAALLAAHGAPEVLVNNAGIAEDGLFVRLPRRRWDAMIAVNLGGFFTLTQPVVRHMLRRRGGRIVNVASLVGQRGNAGQVGYAASKAGLIGATKALALELASRQITVNAVAPGLIDTEMAAGPAHAQIVAQVPMRRAGTPEEVAAAVGFLCSPQAAYITGQVLAVNGGLYT